VVEQVPFASMVRWLKVEAQSVYTVWLHFVLEQERVPAAERPHEEESYDMMKWVVQREDQADDTSPQVGLGGRTAQFDFHNENAWDELSPPVGVTLLLIDMDLSSRLQSANLTWPYCDSSPVQGAR
jgi:hypothetical protein